MKTENLSLSFSLALFQIPTDPTFYVYEGKEYLVFTLGKADNGGLTFIEPNVPRLLVPKDNSDFARQIKQDKEKNNFLTVFSTSLGNLKFEPDLDFTKKESLRNLSLIIKDNQQVKKSTTKSENHFQITFKVRSQKPGKENQWRSYHHLLEIEPLDLGIENLPKITQIEFNFKHHSHPTPGGFRDPSKDKDLAESELYKTKMLAKTVGKTFTMKFNQFWIEDQNKLSFSGDNYVFGSFAEVKEEKTPNDDQNSPPDKNSPDNTPPPNSPKNDSNQNSTSHSKTWKMVLITSGIFLTLSLITIFAFRYFSKKKKKTLNFEI